MCCVPARRQVIDGGLTASHGDQAPKHNYASMMKQNGEQAVVHNSSGVAAVAAAVVSAPTSATASRSGSSGCGDGSPTLIAKNPPTTCSAESEYSIMPKPHGSQPSMIQNGALLPVALTTPPSKKRRRTRKKLPPGLTAKNNERQFVKHNYHDHAQDDPQEYIETMERSAFRSPQASPNHPVKLCGGPGNSGGVTVPFPFRLHTLLDQIEADGYSQIISWQPHGRAFKVHNKTAFVEEIMPRYFKQSKITSFQRQLNLYGFTRLSKGTDSGGYYHELFLRHMSFLCHHMVRTKCKGTGFKAASDPDSEPNFYEIPFVDKPKDYWKRDQNAALLCAIQQQHQPFDVAQTRQSFEENGCHMAQMATNSDFHQDQNRTQQDLYIQDCNIRSSSQSRMGSRKTSVPLVCFDFQDPDHIQSQYMSPVPGSVLPEPRPFLDSAHNISNDPDLPLDFLTGWDERSPAQSTQEQTLSLDYSNLLKENADAFEPTPLVTRNYYGNEYSSPRSHTHFQGHLSCDAAVVACASQKQASQMQFRHSFEGLELPFDGTRRTSNSERGMMLGDDDDSMMQAIMSDASDLLTELNQDNTLTSIDTDESLGRVLEFLIEC